ncbi:MAG: hypothetical protein OXH64_06010 [Rhodospirillaceae bacterium]|nr:hypothetical protein [Rhodospirillaceae bacterium]
MDAPIPGPRKSHSYSPATILAHLDFLQAEIDENLVGKQIGNVVLCRLHRFLCFHLAL